MEAIKKYFSHLDSTQMAKMEQLFPLYQEWNQKINVISRKDMDNFYNNHVLHSLAIAKITTFAPGTRILDVGTGGGFPGIPLAIVFPQCSFYLLDSIEKKVKVVREVASSLQLDNVTALRDRVENATGQFDFVISRAVTTLPKFVEWTRGKISKKQKNDIPNGILYLKGGDFMEELNQINHKIRLYEISGFFEEEFFETKKIVHLY
ncbi:MAG: 16S rRNA (guanine(527)-N(7))-methyltransferase RsmG [Bacteroidetes bacterium]|nr:MAG: 16S rRNA (guanine(527)-N(7))-methyltransferase RsmG [Bacteroidota bacterium]